MSIIKERIQLITTLTKEVKEHCMCFELLEEESHYIVLYPEGFQLDGIRMAKVGGKANTLQKILDTMEQHWIESYPGKVCL